MPSASAPGIGRRVGRLRRQALVAVVLRRHGHGAACRRRSGCARRPAGCRRRRSSYGVARVRRAAACRPAFRLAGIVRAMRSRHASIGNEHPRCCKPTPHLAPTLTHASGAGQRKRATLRTWPNRRPARPGGSDPLPLRLLGRHRHGAGDRGGRPDDRARLPAAHRPRHARGGGPRRGGLVRLHAPAGGVRGVAATARTTTSPSACRGHRPPRPDARQQIVDAWRGRGGFGFLAHPFSKGSERFKRGGAGMPWSDLDAEGYTGIELWSFVTDSAERVNSIRELLSFIAAPSRFLDHPPRRNLDEWDRLCARRRCVALGGVDAHQVGIRVRGRVPLRLMAYKRSFRHLRTHCWCRSRSRATSSGPRGGVRRAARGPRVHRRRLACARARLSLLGGGRRRARDGRRGCGRVVDAAGAHSAAGAAAPDARRR